MEDAGGVRARLFGALELENGLGRVREPEAGGGRPWLLLKYLLADPGREVGREELRFAVWPDLPPRWEGAARVRLRRLRAALAPIGLDGTDGLVLCHNYTYRLNPAWPLQVDAEEFAALAGRLRGLSMDDPAGLTMCRRCLELYRGELLAGTEDAPWLEGYRAAYGELLRRVAGETVERMEALGDRALAPLLCRRAARIKEDPFLQKRLVRFLMENGSQEELIGYIAALARGGIIRTEGETAVNIAVDTRLGEKDVLVRLFGRVELENGKGSAAEPLSRKSVPWLLMKYLLLRPDGAATLDEVMDEAWAGQEGNNLNAAAIRLKRMREALAPLGLDGTKGLILRRGDRLWLNPEYTVRTDAGELTAALSLLEDLPEDDPAGLELCARSLELFRGPLLEYTEEAPWVSEARELYAQRFRTLAEETLARMERTGDDSAAGLLAGRAAEVIPEDEGFHRELIRYLTGRGLQVELTRYVARLACRGDRRAEWVRPA